MHTSAPWRTSTACESHSCVQWRANSHCGDNACATCSPGTYAAQVRDTKLDASPTLSFSAPAWRAFLATVTD